MISAERSFASRELFFLAFREAALAAPSASLCLAMISQTAS